METQSCFLALINKSKPADINLLLFLKVTSYNYNEKSLTKIQTILLSLSLRAHTLSLSLSLSLSRALSRFFFFSFFLSFSMGSCFSSDIANSVAPTSAKVISINGGLREYSVPVKVSQVLDMGAPSCFVCNSDTLYYDNYIPALDSDQELQVGQIYFVLPVTKLQYPLTASDMLDLAVKASSAIANSGKKSSRRRKTRISPVLDVNMRIGDEDTDGIKRFEKAGFGLSRSGSVRKLQRNASKRAKMTYRKFRVKLSTIYEGTVAE